MSSGPPSSTQAQPESRKDYTLRFAEDGTFQITVFSDLHFAEAENSVDGPAQDKRTVEVVKKVLDRENSKLVVLNGDLISGYGTVTDNATLYLDQIVDPIVQKDIPFATTYGNHDNQAYSKSSELFEREKTYPNSLTQNMIPGNAQAGVSNYYLQVYAASGAAEVPDVILWFFDSRGGTLPHDWVDDSVVEWFEKANANLVGQYKKTIPSLAFFHIPISSQYEFQNNPGVNPSREPGINGETVVWQGQMFDGKTGHDVAFMRALANTDGLMATFSGHDHNNDWCYKWTDTLPSQDVPGKGVNVCYGRHTGYGGYGHLARGGRQIVLKKDTLKDKEVVTWIRLEDGLVPANVTLNATYGQDEYHPLRHLELRSIAGSGSHCTQLAAGIYSTGLFVFLLMYLPLRLWN
ncbi:Metallo-dependent phosphatase [Aspergillus coremiiformis]|uniref:Metallo-dependent phosphatase n=1 Tax=Aspergillus coremiiformis TaxID=138285 RepID=A0A5N6Z833_9EURO|nr:Metallo-dependent phosphatase [Aspergillus coremiiformis]